MIPEKKPLLYLKKDDTVTPTEYTIHVAAKAPGNYKFSAVRDDKLPSGGSPTDPEEHAVSIVMTEDSSPSSPSIVIEKSHLFTANEGESFVKVYLVDDTSSGGGATSGIGSIDFNDAE